MIRTFMAPASIGAAVPALTGTPAPITPGASSANDLGIAGRFNAALEAKFKSIFVDPMGEKRKKLFRDDMLPKDFSMGLAALTLFPTKTTGAIGG